MTKTELINKCKLIRDKYNDKEIISEEDKNWLIKNVFSYHEEWDWWKRQGVKDISVARINKNGFVSRCFYIHFERPEGKSCADISWNKSLKNYKYIKN